MLYRSVNPRHVKEGDRIVVLLNPYDKTTEVAEGVVTQVGLSALTEAGVAIRTARLKLDSGKEMIAAWMNTIDDWVVMELDNAGGG